MAWDESRYARAGLQALLNARGAKIKVDGVFGPKSQAAFDQHADATLKKVKEEFAIPDAPPSQAPSANKVFVSQAELDAAIAAANKRFPGTEPFLRLMVSLENYVVPGGVFTTFGGDFQGVGQFSQTTWNLGKAKLPEVGAYENVKDTAKTMLLAAWYADDHKEKFRLFRRRSGATGSYSPEIAYLYHQQGQSAAEKYLETGSVVYPKQSSKSLVVLRSARESAMARTNV